MRDIKAEIDVNGYIRSLINNEVVFHNDKFDFDYVLKEIWVHEDIFARGLCLPSDIKMTEEEQDYVIEQIKNCF